MNAIIFVTVQADAGSPTYRIWVDDLLIVERDFWPDVNERVIREQIYLDLEAGEHTIKLENIPKKTVGKVWISECTVNDISQPVLPSQIEFLL
jgi:hypothetical protein